MATARLAAGRGQLLLDGQQRMTPCTAIIRGRAAVVLRWRRRRVRRAAVPSGDRGVRVPRAGQDEGRPAVDRRHRADSSTGRGDLCGCSSAPERAPRRFAEYVDRSERLRRHPAVELPHRGGHRRGQDGRRRRRHLQPGQHRRHQAVQGRSRAGEDLRRVARRPPGNASQPGPLARSGLPASPPTGCCATSTRWRPGVPRSPRWRTSRPRLSRTRSNETLHHVDHFLDELVGGPARPGPRPRADGPLRDPRDLPAACTTAAVGSSTAPRRTGRSTGTCMRRCAAASPARRRPSWPRTWRPSTRPGSTA